MSCLVSSLPHRARSTSGLFSPSSPLIQIAMVAQEPEPVRHSLAE